MLMEANCWASSLSDSGFLSSKLLFFLHQHWPSFDPQVSDDRLPVSHSSTESEIISLDAGLRLDGILALDLWYLIVLVVGNTIQTHDRTAQPSVGSHTSHAPSQRSRGMFNVSNIVDLVPSNVQYSHQEALLYVFEDHEAVIKMIFEGRTPTMRHVSRPHRVALDWWPGGWGPKAWPKQVAADSRGSRTCVCANTYPAGWHRREGRMNQHPAVVPPSRRGKNLQ